MNKRTFIITDRAVRNDQRMMKQGVTQNSKSVKRVKESDVAGTPKEEGKQPSRSRAATHAEAGDVSRNTTVAFVDSSRSMTFVRDEEKKIS